MFFSLRFGLAFLFIYDFFNIDFWAFFFFFEIKDQKFSIGLGLPNFLFTRVCKFLLYGVKKKNVIYNFFF